MSATTAARPADVSLFAAQMPNLTINHCVYMYTLASLMTTNALIHLLLSAVLNLRYLDERQCGHFDIVI